MTKVLVKDHDNIRQRGGGMSGFDTVLTHRRLAGEVESDQLDLHVSWVVDDFKKLCQLR